MLLVLLARLIAQIWLHKVPNALSPYTRHPLRPGSEISYYAANKVLRFLYDRHEYDNRIFDLRRAAVCRDTGRIFPNAITWYNKIKVDWSFLAKRYPGNYVSWGSLSAAQQVFIAAHHDSLKGFQTEISSTQIQPKAIEASCAYSKPGPLYVDIDTGVLLGWVCVPDTDMEVLIVQHPKRPLKKLDI